MPPPLDADQPSHWPPVPGDGKTASAPGIAGLISRALKIRSLGRHALHPVEAVVQYHRDSAEIPGEEGHGGSDFEQAEAQYRAGAEGLRLSEIPQLPRRLRELSRLSTVDRAGRRTLRRWVEETGRVIDEVGFFRRWHAQGDRGGAEHQVYHDEECG